MSFPPDAEMTKRHDEIPAWDDMPAVLARQMEIYAGFLEHAFYQRIRALVLLARG